MKTPSVNANENILAMVERGPGYLRLYYDAFINVVTMILNEYYYDSGNNKFNTATSGKNTKRRRNSTVARDKKSACKSLDDFLKNHELIDICKFDIPAKSMVKLSDNAVMKVFWEKQGTSHLSSGEQILGETLVDFSNLFTGLGKVLANAIDGSRKKDNDAKKFRNFKEYCNNNFCNLEKILKRLVVVFYFIENDMSTLDNKLPLDNKLLFAKIQRILSSICLLSCYFERSGANFGSFITYFTDSLENMGYTADCAIDGDILRKNKGDSDGPKVQPIKAVKENNVAGRPLPPTPPPTPIEYYASALLNIKAREEAKKISSIHKLSEEEYNEAIKSLSMQGSLGSHKDEEDTKDKDVNIEKELSSAKSLAVKDKSNKLRNFLVCAFVLSSIISFILLISSISKCRSIAGIVVVVVGVIIELIAAFVVLFVIGTQKCADKINDWLDKHSRKSKNLSNDPSIEDVDKEPIKYGDMENPVTNLADSKQDSVVEENAVNK